MKVSVFGLGYVGCVSLGCLAKNGHSVIGVDISETKVKQINRGLPTIIENEIDIIIQEEYSKNKISATTDFKTAVLKTDVSIVAVGTPSCAKGHLLSGEPSRETGRLSQSEIYSAQLLKRCSQATTTDLSSMRLSMMLQGVFLDRSVG